MPKSTCSIDGCEAPVNCRGMCKPHYRKDYYLRNKAHENATNKAYREARPEYWKSRWSEYYTGNEEHSARRKANYEANREEILAYHAEWWKNHPESLGMWRKNNPERWAIKNRENTNRRKRAPGSGPVSYGKILESYGMVCHICSDNIPSLEELHFDHVIPLSKGGPHSMENIKPAHAFCNLRKGARLIAQT